MVLIQKAGPFQANIFKTERTAKLPALFLPPKSPVQHFVGIAHFQASCGIQSLPSQSQGSC